ncbi:uncharacterized protein PgNI_01206, partial [Pyricularia grisea]|uniref:Uncharacterized protein n=1 Tax=Pyricularia grisea TaxID=148305 RepID=A0A6P8BKT8_PYRGI
MFYSLADVMMDANTYMLACLLLYCILDKFVPSLGSFFPSSHWLSFSLCLVVITYHSFFHFSESCAPIRSLP